MQHTDAPDAIIVSEGTLQPLALLDAFLLALDDRREAFALDGGRVTLVSTLDDFMADFETWRAAEVDPDREAEHAEAAADWLDRFEALLSEHAPEGMYFGASEGDGACFGYWPCDASECDFEVDGEGMGDGSEWEPEGGDPDRERFGSD
jgi:hypothetical protein